MRLARELLLRYGLLVALVALWQLVTVQAQSLYFPPPSAIAAAFVQRWFSGPPSHLFLTPAVGHDIVPSLWRTGLGWAAAALTGVIAGLAIGRIPTLAYLVNPIVQFLRSMPGPALVPIFLVLFSTGSTMRVALIAFGSLWPILLNTIDGVRSVDAVQLETAQAFGLPGFARLRHVILPAALPRIFAGLRIAIAVALILMVVSELVAGTDGIGNAIAAAQHSFMLPDMWAGFVLIGIVGYGLNALFLGFEHRVLAWHRGARMREPA